VKEGILEALLSGGLEGLLQNKDRGEGKEIGAITPELMAAYKANNRKADRLKEECDLEQRRLVMEMKRKLEDMFDDRIEEVEDEKQELWRKIEAQFGLSEDSDLSIDPKTGVITQYVKTEEDVFDFRPKK
jgi:hypothetical protein